jgi:hypothetical protein
LAVAEKKKKKRTVASFAIEEREYRKFRDLCHTRLLYASGVLRTLVSLYLDGKFNAQIEKIISNEAQVQEGVGGRGWQEYAGRSAGKKVRPHRKKG